jgi:hypothetical protein
MHQIEESVRIDRPPEEVRAAIADYSFETVQGTARALG